jgi:hypothetical protein
LQLQLEVQGLAVTLGKEGAWPEEGLVSVGLFGAGPSVVGSVGSGGFTLGLWWTLTGLSCAVEGSWLFWARGVVPSIVPSLVCGSPASVSQPLPAGPPL